MKKSFLSSKITLALAIVIISLATWKYKGIYNTYIAPAVNKLNSTEAVADTLFITIEEHHFRKIETKREEALNKGLLLGSSGDFVPASIVFDGNRMEAKVRLKGKLPDHYKDDRWSFRINLNGNNRIDGIKKFAIQDPQTRRNIHEWVFQQMLAHENLLNVEYRFINVVLNGKFKGIYAFEEKLDKNYLAKRNIEKGVIFGFSNNAYWQDLLDHKYDFRQYENKMFLQAPISCYNKIDSKDTLLRKQYDELKLKLIDWKQGVIPTSEIFDVEILGRYLAVVEVCKAHHAFNWTNIKFFFNPATKKIEPIGIDGNGGTTIQLSVLNNHKAIPSSQLQAFFSDSIILDAYTRELNRIDDSEYLDDLLKSIESRLQNNLNLIYQNDPGFIFEKENYYGNGEE